uniref:Calcium/calmodulin-dependent serine protein kinase/membrane-associated guanylate kinase n=1 Tax=Macrostomum lignano TaxID=282301 RepID=A0A1I8G1P5_9PLAT
HLTNFRREPRQVLLSLDPGCSSSGSSSANGSSGGGPGLGFNIVGGQDGAGVFVSGLLPGGIAERSRRLRRGDQLLAVNGADLCRAGHCEAAAALKSAVAAAAAASKSGKAGAVQLLVAYRPEEFTRFQARVLRAKELQQQQQAAAAAAEAMLPTADADGDADVGTATLKTTQKRSVYVRAEFDFDPARESGLPNRGIAFRRGDILHVTNASDDEWWQARRVGNSGSQASFGIVPSKRRVERRERAKLRKVNFNNSRSGSGGGGSTETSLDGSSGGRGGGGSLDRSSAKKKPSLLQRLHIGHHHHHHHHHDHQSGQQQRSLQEDDDDLVSAAATASGGSTEAGSQRIPSYELVRQTKPTATRPIILLGPLRDQLNDALASNYPDRFASCVPHTTRAPREGEEDGRDYHFVASREQMERDIAGQQFVEAGRYNGNLYGTSVQSVRAVADSGRHCILDVSGQAIRRLEAAGLHPIVIFLRPLAPENIAQLRPEVGPEQAAALFEKAGKIEAEFGSMFTAAVSGSTVEDLFAQVRRVIAQHWCGSPAPTTSCDLPRFTAAEADSCTVAPVTEPPILHAQQMCLSA